MNYYVLMVALVLIAALLMHGTREKNLRFVVVACILLYGIYGLRDTFQIGVDSVTSYNSLFWKLRDYSWKGIVNYSNGKNTMFNLSIKAFWVLAGDDYQLFVSLIALFVTICFGHMIYRFSPDPLQSILYHLGLLLFTFHFSALKQSIAMAILMLSLDQIEKRKPLRFLLLVLIAGQFHLPALVFLPAYALSYVKINKSFLVILGIILVSTYLFRNQLLNLMLRVYNEKESSSGMDGVQFLRTKALIMVGIVVSAYCFRLPTDEDWMYRTLLLFMCTAIVFQTFCGYDNTFERLADYYFQFSIVFIPMVFDKNVKRKALVGWRFLDVVNTIAPYLFSGFAVYRFITYTRDQWYLYPFHFFFEK